MIEKTYHQKIRNATLNRTRNYYKNDKGRLREQARDIIKCLYHNMSEEINKD